MKKIIIIGAGVSGLAAGCYAAMNGFDTEIFEMGSAPGGVCASWRRGEYLFDHCLHWVLGSGKGNSMYPLFKELRITDSVEFYQSDRFRRIKCGGKDVTVYTDIDLLEKELISHFPQESKRLRKMTAKVRFYTRFRPPMDADFGNFGFAGILKMLPFMPSFLRLKSITVKKYIEQFRDPVLREVLFSMFPVPDMPALMVIMPLAYFHNHEGGYPMGGSLNFARAIADNFIRLGGNIRYREKVNRIIVDGGRAAGVETKNGEKHYADIVISACDARTVLYDMLEGKYMPRAWEEIFKKPCLWPPIVCVSLGVNRDLSGEAELQTFKPDNPVEVCGQKLERIYYSHYCHDRAFAPKGKSVIAMQFDTDYGYWKALSGDKKAYENEKRNVLNALVAALETQLPGVGEQIEASDVATPLTWERYTGNWMGSYEGWLPEVRLFGRTLPRELQGLSNFYLTGQWVFPGGGVPMCLSMARRLIKQICVREGRDFSLK
ncbi:MAG: Dehydrosqualene desaturase [Firmicutes bacterium ADurb.Bin182]|nr:MAG: Dehydrosqualene desaturase [Firmicutes bacterium ADurb.Bin182]